MTKTIIKIRTWDCTQCNYHQDFEPTQELMNVNFNNIQGARIRDIRANECPSCALKGKRGILMKKETDPAKKMKMTAERKLKGIEYLNSKALLKAEKTRDAFEGSTNPQVIAIKNQLSGIIDYCRAIDAAIHGSFVSLKIHGE